MSYKESEARKESQKFGVNSSNNYENNNDCSFDEISSIFRDIEYREFDKEKVNFYLDNRVLGANLDRVDFYRYPQPAPNDSLGSKSLRDNLCRKFSRGFEITFRPSVEKGAPFFNKVYSLDEGIYSDHGIGDDQPQRWISEEAAGIDIGRLKLKELRNKADTAKKPFYHGSGKFEIEYIICIEMYDDEENCWIIQSEEKKIVAIIGYLNIKNK